jgi:mono/diheme cytochrome c family protein
MNRRAFIGPSLLLMLLGISGCRKQAGATNVDTLRSAYDNELDWTDAQHVIPLTYREAQGKRIFYQQCVWCHADSTPAGPSNRSNLTPTPPLLNDGATLNAESDESMQSIVTLGGSAMGKSAMMPAYGRVLTPEEVRSVIAFTRAIAQPLYQPPGRPGSQYTAN